MRLTIPLAALFLSGFTPLAMGDQFETIDGRSLAAWAKSPDARRVERLGFEEIAGLPRLLKDTRSGLLIARTSRGNLARILVLPELRKPAEGPGEPFPVVVLDRFDTFDAADLGARIARGREMVVFPGFQVDLDTGQVVPEGQGGDLAFETKAGPALIALPGTTLYRPDRAPASASSEPTRPSPRRVVIPTDFSGRYQLFANGQWSGSLDLKATAEGEISGAFRSDAGSSSYPVSGRVDDNPSHKATLTVKFPRARGDFEGYLWTEGKGAIAGTFRLLDRTYGFFAIREGGRIASGEADAIVPATSPGVACEIVGEKARIGTEVVGIAEIGAAIRRAGVPEAVIVRAGGDIPFSRVLCAVEALRSAGVGTVRVGPMEGEGSRPVPLRGSAP